MTRGDDPTGRATRSLEKQLHSHAVKGKMSDCCAARPTYAIYKMCTTRGWTALPGRYCRPRIGVIKMGISPNK